ncbi:MAG: hypothetical protein AAB909_01975 [Patescibacteria group bacterium]
MSRNKYNADPKKRQIVGLCIAAVVFVVSLILIFKLPPGNMWVETGVMILVAIWIFFLSAWICKSKKWGGVVTLAILYLLIMNRIGYLNWISFGVLLVLVGLISLVN